MPEIIDLEVAKENILEKVGKKTLSEISIPVEKVLQNATPLDVKDSVERKVLKSISRISKLLLFEFGENIKLVIHLMLHGNFCWKSIQDKHKGVVCEMEFETGDIVLIKDWSAWMKIELDDPQKGIESELLKKKYGVDPFSTGFTKDKLLEILNNKSRSNIKSILMDQELIAGIGNAYADESLFEAKIHPKSKAKGIVEAGKIDILHESILKVLNDALDIVRDLSGGEEIAEQERDFMKVYRKSGQKCPRCGYMIVQMKVAGRDTHVCEKCQVLY